VDSSAQEHKTLQKELELGKEGTQVRQPSKQTKNYKLTGIPEQ
jgi:hypothetical protein